MLSTILTLQNYIKATSQNYNKATFAHRKAQNGVKILKKLQNPTQTGLDSNHQSQIIWGSGVFNTPLIVANKRLDYIL